MTINTCNEPQVQTDLLRAQEDLSLLASAGQPAALLGKSTADSSRQARALNPRAAVIYGLDPVCRALLGRILQRAGLSVQAVEDSSGLGAAVERSNPGCVFIDCDDARGFDLARAIREYESGEHALLIAVTGSASREHRKARKVSGFDNYVARPIRQEAVRALLARNSLGNCQGAISSLAVEQRTVAEVSELMDWDTEAVEQLYRHFLALASDSLCGMRRALEDANGRQVAAHAQSLRTASGQVGAIRMQELCLGIEALAREDLLDGVEAMVQELALAFEAVSREIFGPDFTSRTREHTGVTRGVGQPRRLPASPGRLLLAEPDPLTARFLMGALEGAGFNVTVATTGHDALEHATRHEHQAVLLGTGLAGTDGYSVLSNLRLTPSRIRTPVILISASSQEHDLLRAFDLGADDYLVKPLNPLEVVSRVKRFLR